MSLEQRLADAFRKQGITEAVITPGDKILSVKLAADCPPITNACKVDSRCCLQNGHDDKCDVTIHRHFTAILAKMAFNLGIDIRHR